MFQMDALLTVGYFEAQRERHAAVAADCSPYSTALQADVLPFENPSCRLKAKERSGSYDKCSIHLCAAT